MSKRYLFAGLVGGLFVLAGGGGWAAAQDKAAPPATKESADGEAVKNIALAFDLAALGRKTESPEMLIAAAKVLVMYQSNPAKDSPKVEGGTDEPVAPQSLADEARKLLTEAKDLAKGDSTVTALADTVGNGLSRGSFGGPRAYTHQPGSGVQLTWNVNFVPGQPARVSVVGNGRNSLTLTATFPGGHVTTFTGPNPALVHVPTVGGTTVITVVNNGPGVCQYTIRHN